MTEAITETPSETIPAALARAVDLWPDKIWLDFSGDKRSFAEADAESTRLARGLAALGLSMGDRMCSILDNHVDHAILWMALSKLGVVHVPINTAFRGEFLRHQIADAGAKIVACDVAYLENIIAVEAGIPEVQTLLYRGDLGKTDTRLNLRQLGSVVSEDQRPIEATAAPNDLAMLLYTSGTTGPSKGCMIPHSYICRMGFQSNRHIGIGHDDIYWTPCPLFHMGAAGGLIGTLHTGATMSVYPRFSLSAFWPEIERSQATVVMILSSMLNYVADGPDTEVSQRCHGQIRTVHGTPFSDDLALQWKRRFGVQNAGAVGYGMTECCSITLRDLEKPVPAGASGHEFEDFEVMIVDPEDKPLPPGTPGEVVVRPRLPGIMFQGYWRRPEATVEVFRNLWFHTGDIGRLDANKFFYWLDRKKDYLRRGGENISSYELEVAFREHPEIEDVAVHAVPAEGAEDEVKVTAIMRPDARTSEEALCIWAAERLPAFAVPRFIEYRQELPRNATGKVLKYELRAQGITADTWDKKNSSLEPARKATRVST